jgi:hypothetical protein
MRPDRSAYETDISIIRHQRGVAISGPSNPRLLRQSLLILALLIGSYAVGFPLMILLYRSTPATSEQSNEASSQPKQVETASLARDVVERRDDTVFVQNSLSTEGNAAPEVPPGKRPVGVRVVGAPLYLRCWDLPDNIHAGKDCKRLRGLEKRFASRLYIVDRCKRRHTDDSAEGKLSIGVDVNFEKERINFWSGPSTDLSNANAIGTCLCRELAGLPLHGIEPSFPKYRIYFTVVFEDPEKLRAQPAQMKANGRSVKVVKKNVRVRLRPKDGKILDKMSRPNQVVLVERRDEWCQVITPNDQAGWMICDALAL